MDYTKLQGDLLRALRGQLSQRNLSQRLGYRHNQVYRWETGRSALPWTRFLKIASLCGVRRETRSLKTALNFKGSAEDTAALVAHLLAGTPLTQAAATCGISRFTLSRWLHGHAEPGLAQMLRLVDTLSPRLLPFVRTFAPLGLLPDLRERFEAELQDVQLHREHPWSGALLEALALESYRNASAPSDALLAQATGLSPSLVRDTLSWLHRTGHIRREGDRWVLEPTRSPTPSDRSVWNATREYWFARAARYLESDPAPSPRNKSGYLLLSCSEPTYREIVRATFSYLSQIRTLLGRDRGPKTVVSWMGLALFDLAYAPDPR